MARTPGVFDASFNLDPQIAAPLDSRQKVETLSDLTAAVTWDGVFTYKGLIVVVTDDPIPTNNGVYVLMGDDYSVAANWIAAGSGGGSNVEIIGESKLLERITNDITPYWNAAGLPENTACLRGVIQVGDWVYVSGGYDVATDTSLPNMSRLNLRTKEIEILPEFIAPLGAFGQLLHYDGYLYCRQTDITGNKFGRLSIKGGIVGTEWEELADQLYSSRGGPGIGYNNEIHFVSGGSGSSLPGAVVVVPIYNIDTNTWREAPLVDWDFATDSQDAYITYENKLYYFAPNYNVENGVWVCYDPETEVATKYDNSINFATGLGIFSTFLDLGEGNILMSYLLDNSEANAKIAIYNIPSKQWIGDISIGADSGNTVFRAAVGWGFLDNKLFSLMGTDDTNLSATLVAHDGYTQWDFNWDVTILYPGDTITAESPLMINGTYVAAGELYTATAAVMVNLFDTQMVGATIMRAIEGGGIPEAPEDGKQYARQDATWTEVTGGGAPVPAFTQTFTQADLTTDILTITHNQNTRTPIIIIYDNEYKIVLPQEVTGTDANTAEISFEYLTPLTGTWTVVASSGASGGGGSGVSDYNLLTNKPQITYL